MRERLLELLIDTRDLLVAFFWFLLWVPLGMVVSAILRGLHTEGDEL